ncbi:delta-12 fatty acid desaturase [Exidia glandulosa HHB12029]|uniref:Delta-12 fatty acid desaturase n=1 Tax=Exidia glandulosa HHB12029 TaxID=1314781 RepID=A0A165GWF5_EXIGL|nr:delta-12 fatty acid desaturase [Exidia glandulosa HHB12029]
MPGPTKSDDARETVEQVDFIVPALTVKDLLSAIPAHCMQRSALRSGVYVVWDFALLYCIYKLAALASDLATPRYVALPHLAMYSVAWWSIWAAYGFAAGLVMTGLWVIGHECGHQAFSDSKVLNNTIGWILHSGIGVPYFSFRITHAKHHAANGHLYQDQVYIPKTRSQLGLPPLDPSSENLEGSSVTEKMKKELYEAIGDSPIAAALGVAFYVLMGWPLYLTLNLSNQRTEHFANHFLPRPPLFEKRHFWQIILSDIGVFLWVAGLVYWSFAQSFGDMMRLYGVPYLWMNHWLVIMTFLQHTDPLIPYYRPEEFNFARGALTTFDRSLLGGAGKFWAWVGAFTTHGLAETHVLHHVASRIPHYHAWEATYALRQRLEREGIKLIGGPCGWSEMYRVYRQCVFIEDQGSIVFYKNVKGLAAARPVFPQIKTTGEKGVHSVN